MLRAAEVPLSALVSPFQAELGALCHFNYEMEASEDRSSDERYDGPAQPTKLANSGARSMGVTSSQCRGASRNVAVACAPWVPSFLAATYFQPCERHRHHKKNECTFFCVTCGVKPQSVCQHCMGAHAGHQVIQVRRYVYCDVVRACDISPYVDASGVQNYIINSAKVMFLNHRPHSKIGRANGVDICRSCHRHLREGFSYCSLACKVEALTHGDTTLVCPPEVAPRATAAQPAATGGHPPHPPPPPGVTGAVTTSNSRPRPTGNLSSPAPGGGGDVGAGSFSPRPRSIFASASRAGGGAFSAAAAGVTGSPELAAAAAADMSCAALSSDPESSEQPGEDTFVFGGSGSTSPLAAAGSATAAAALARRRTVAVRDRDSTSYGSASSKEDDEHFYEFNFENPPKRRRSSHISRRTSTSNGFSIAPLNIYSIAAARTDSADLDAAAAADAEAAATAAATLMMPFRRTTSSGRLPVAQPPPPLPTIAAAAVACGGMPSLFCGAEPSAGAGASNVSIELARAGCAFAVLSSRRKQNVPSRAPSC